VSRLKRARRIILLVAVLVVIVVVGAGVFAVGVVRQTFPQTNGTLEIEGLSSPVTVKRDAQGVPTIYADTAQDLFRAQGFVSAQDRFFEMDLRRHITAGRLAELVGESGVDSDKVIRTMGWRRVAEAELPKLAPETRQYLQAYADGVNAYIRQAGSPEKMSLEYTFLQRTNPTYRVEPWTPADSLAWLKAMAWDLRGDYNDELARARLSRSKSVKQISLLYPPYPYDRNLPILSEDDWSPSEATTSAATATPAAYAAMRGPDGRAAIDSTLHSIDAVTATTSARTRGSSPGPARPRASRCSPTTRT
jgi:penicillin amidase